MSNSGIVNVRMVITEEKIISNIDKVQKLINPNSKKKIVQLEEDAYFKDLVESIKTYLIEYPKKKNFPVSVYNAAYSLVEYVINQFEENTKKIEELIRQREENIALAGVLKDLIVAVDTKAEDWKERVYNAEDSFSDDIIETLNVVGKSRSNTTQKYADSMKLLNARVNNLESNLHIEIDMERLEDSSKALSFIGIEISDALKLIPVPEERKDVREANVSTNRNLVEKSNDDTMYIDEIEDNIGYSNSGSVRTIKKNKKLDRVSDNAVAISEVQTVNEVENERYKQQVQNIQHQIEEYEAGTTFKTKTTLWQKFKNSKIIRAATYVFRIKIRIELPSNALPEGRGEN